MNLHGIPTTHEAAAEDFSGFTGCTNGSFFGTLSPVCNGPVVSVNTAVNSFSGITVEQGAIYLFNTSTNPNIPQFYITIPNSSGTTILAAGAAPLEWQANFSGQVRYYTHGSPDCAGLVTGQPSQHLPRVRSFCYDCPGLLADIGDSCDDGLSGTSNTTVTADCTCEGDFIGCTTGTLDPLPLRPRCGHTAERNPIFRTYNNVELFAGGAYTFSVPEGNDNNKVYITLTNTAGNEILAAGINSVTYTSPSNQNLRFYTHHTPDCDASPIPGTHTRRVVANCDDVVFSGCTSGNLFGTRTTSCSAATNPIGNAQVNQYSSIAVLNQATYTFSTSLNTVLPNIFITITNADASIIYATGINSVQWQSESDQVVRFYAHGASNCGSQITGSASAHSRNVSIDCSTVPDCVEVPGNIGDDCDDDDLTTAFDEIQADCTCAGTPTVPGGYCGNPLVISQLPFSASGNTIDFGNIYQQDDLPEGGPVFPDLSSGAGSGSSLNGPEVVFAYTPATNQTVNLLVANLSSFSGAALWVVGECPLTTLWAFDTNGGVGFDGPTRSIDNLPLQGGLT